MPSTRLNELVAAATAGVCVGAAFYAFSVKRASESPPLRKIEVPVGSTPVLLITDIGADIDDTFAMIALAGAPSCHLVGVVTSVNDGVARAAVARGWMRRCGVSDEVPVLPSLDVAVAGCVVPEGWSHEPRMWGDVADTPARILEIAALYEDLVVVAIAPVTPLAEALKIDHRGVLQRVKRVYVQGNVVTDPSTKRLKPDPQAYNFRVHMGAAERVLDSMQDRVPFSFLGKFAAYKVGLTRSDLEAIDGLVLAHAVDGAHQPLLPGLTNMARDQMNQFRLGNFELWSKLYPVPAKHNGLGSMEWFDHLPGGIVSHPYDPLCILLLTLDASAASETIDPMPIFSRIQIGYPRAAMSDEKDRKCHWAVGNSTQDHGVPDEELTRAALVAAMRKGIGRCLELK